MDRIIARRSVRGRPQYLVKWLGLEYSDAIWEKEEDLLGADDQVGVSLCVLLRENAVCMYA